jgi:hypothetical protein
LKASAHDIGWPAQCFGLPVVFASESDVGWLILDVDIEMKVRMKTSTRQLAYIASGDATLRATVKHHDNAIRQSKNQRKKALAQKQDALAKLMVSKRSLK